MNKTAGLEQKIFERLFSKGVKVYKGSQLVELKNSKLRPGGVLEAIAHLSNLSGYVLVSHFRDNKTFVEISKDTGGTAEQIASIARTALKNLGERPELLNLMVSELYDRHYELKTHMKYVDADMISLRTDLEIPTDLWNRLYKLRIKTLEDLIRHPCDYLIVNRVGIGDLRLRELADILRDTGRQDCIEWASNIN
jgi:hypothetical protein